MVAGDTCGEGRREFLFFIYFFIVPVLGDDRELLRRLFLHGTTPLPARVDVESLKLWGFLVWSLFSLVLLGDGCC